MKLGNCFSKFVNQSSSFPELFLDLTTTEPEPELFSFCHFGGARVRAGKARQARLELEPRSGSLDISAPKEEGPSSEPILSLVIKTKLVQDLIRMSESQ